MEQSAGKNFFVKYWNGEIPLWKSFWLINPPFNILDNRIIDYLTFVEDLQARLGLSIVFIIVSVLQTVGLWQSATNYQKDINKNQIWAILTKIYIIMVVFSTIIFSLSLLK